MFNKKNVLSLALVATLALSALVPVNTANAVSVIEGNVTAHSLTVRSGPGSNYTALAWLKKGDKVTVLKDHGEFVYVQYGNKKGYVHEEFLKLTTKTVKDNAIASTGNRGTVIAETLTVRKGPSANYEAIDWVKKGTNVSILEEHGTFVYVQYDNKKGYVHKGYLKVGATTTPTPTPTPTPTTKPATSTQTNVHIVQKGETLWKISTMYKTSVASIQSLNGLNSTVIKVGQQLKVNGSTATPTTSGNTSKPVSGSLSGKLIVLDPGHGGKFAGAQGIVHEEDVNLQIALKTRDELQRLGATVIMTRTSDVHLASVYDNDLAARPAVAKKNGANMFISIHANSGKATANGAEVYWYTSGRGDQKLASSIVKAISNETSLKNRGAKYGNFSVIRNSGSKIPSVLVETGFVSNQKDAAILGSASGQKNIAKGIATGVLKYYGK